MAVSNHIIAELMTDARKFGASPNASAAINTLAIQNAINAAGEGGTIGLFKPGTYLITLGADSVQTTLNTALYLLNGQTLILSRGVTLKLASGSDCYMLRNSDPATGNENIEVIGGTWDQDWTNQTQNVSTAPYWFAHSIWFDNVQNFKFRSMDCLNARKFVFWFTSCTDFTVKDIYFDTPSDGVHIGGGCSKGLVSNLQGFNGDNVVGIVTNEGTYFSGLTTSYSGDITDVVIENIFGTVTSEPVRLTGKAPDSITDIVIRNITGSLKAEANSVVRIIDDSVGGLTGCVMKRILVDGIDMSGGAGGGYSVIIGGDTTEQCTVRNVTMRDMGGVSIGGSSALDHVLIDGVFNMQDANADAVAVTASAEPQAVSVRNVHQRLPVSGTAQCINILGTVGMLHLDDIYYHGASGTGSLVFLQSGASVADGRLGHLTCDSATYCFRGNDGSFRGGHLRLKDTAYLVSSSTIVDLDSLTLEGSANGRTFGSGAKAHHPPRWKSHQVGFADVSTANSSRSVTLGSLPRGAVVHAVRIKHQSSFTGGSLSSVTVSVGNSGNLTKYASAFDIFQAVGVATQQYEESPGVNNINVNESLIARFVSVGANLDALASGLVDIEVLYSVAALNN